MRTEADSVIRHPPARVFRAYRDDMRELVRFLPNVRAIEVVERSEEGGLVQLHNIWRGGIALPEALADALKTDVFSWDDRAVWDEASKSCTWVIRPLAFEGGVVCEGRCDFVDLGDKTRLEMTGELAIKLDSIPGLPKAVASTLGRTAEKFILRQITANLASVADALASYLAE